MSEFLFDAVIFDMDGVITKTATVHATAWKTMFDEYLREREKRDHKPFQEFTYEKDYLTYLDGKPRYEGVRSFLESRNIHLEQGDLSDGLDKETVCGLGNRKNVKFMEVLDRDGVQSFEHVVALIKDLRTNNIHTGVASSSKNCRVILEAAGLLSLFETRVDGVVLGELGLKGKPQPDIFLEAAKNVGSSPDKAIVIEDAVSGVQAGRNGNFALVVGVARENNESDLRDNGADVVVKSFEGITTESLNEWLKNKTP